MKVLFWIEVTTIDDLKPRFIGKYLFPWEGDNMGYIRAC